MRTAHGFTLIELLVVISIVALLSALLLPTIGVARDAARALACQSNMRQLGMAFDTRCADTKGFYPDFQWQEKIQDYLNPEGKIVTYLDGSNTSLEFKPARCPSAPKKNSGGYPLSVTYSYAGVYFDSIGAPNLNPAANRVFFAVQYWGWGLPTNYPSPIIRRAKIVRPSEKCTLSEYYASAARQNWGSDQLSDRRAIFQHRARANFLYADGHVQSGTTYNAKNWSNIQMDQSSPYLATEPMWHPYLDSASTIPQ